MVQSNRDEERLARIEHMVERLQREQTAHTHSERPPSGGTLTREPHNVADHDRQRASLRRQKP